MGIGSSRRLPLLLALLGWVCLLAGCRSAPASEGRRGPSAPHPVVEHGTLLVLNRSQQSVFHLRWRRTDGEDERRWSGDRLDRGDVIPPGSERQFELAPGVYELRLELGDGQNWSPERSVHVLAGSTVSCELPGEPTAKLGTLTVCNETAWAISRVRFSTIDEPSLSERLAKGEFLVAGKSRSWDVPPGRYQIQVMFQDGKTEQGAGDVTPGEATVFRIGKAPR